MRRFTRRYQYNEAKMKLSFALLATTLAVAGASGGGIASVWAHLRRRLSYQKIAGYSPSSQVTDHCAIDLDQAAIESLLSLKTPESFENAHQIYSHGGNSCSYAEVTLATPLASKMRKGDEITGSNAEGLMVGGLSLDDYDSGESVIKVQYITSDVQANYVECQVGALVDPNMKGCLARDGDLIIDGSPYEYTYNPAAGNMNGRTIASFSINAGQKMLSGCKGCPHTDFQYFYDYYGTDDYAHQFVESAFEGKDTKFERGNADFSQYELTGKEQIIKKTTAYMHIFMYVIHEFENSMASCEQGCINCNGASVSGWDRGVCFYTGSMEGTDGAANGKLLHQLADMRCMNFKTCGVEGTDLAGMAKLNYDIFNLIAVGQFQLQTGNCPAARLTTDKIISKMYIPIIQGTLRYAFKVGELLGGEKEKAEGAAFAAAVLPRIHAASPGAATIIYNNMKVGAPSTDFGAVKAAFESTYRKIGFSCSDIGGLWSIGEGRYFPGTEPCTKNVPTAAPDADGGGNNYLAIGLSATFGGLFFIAFTLVIYMRKREKEGNPVFKTRWTFERWRDNLTLNLGGS